MTFYPCFTLFSVFYFFSAFYPFFRFSAFYPFSRFLPFFPLFTLFSAIPFPFFRFCNSVSAFYPYPIWKRWFNILQNILLFSEYLLGTKDITDSVSNKTLCIPPCFHTISRFSNFHSCWYNGISTRKMFYISFNHNIVFANSEPIFTFVQRKNYMFMSKKMEYYKTICRYCK